MCEGKTKLQEFRGGDNGLILRAEASGPKHGAPILFLHGGGQTRGSWKRGATACAAKGYRVYALDARGHGESDWARDGDYSLDAQVRDVREVLRQIEGAPAVVGASMGGTTALALMGDAGAPRIRALILVDVVPEVNRTGVERIGTFMRANMDGFDSIEAAADAVSAYNPNRPRSPNLSGLRRNLREADGRLFWHWDPAFVGKRGIAGTIDRDRIAAAARDLQVPTLLVRGANSDVVGEAEVARFRALMPHADFVDVAGAGHMIAGDRNDAFNAAILAFLGKVDGRC